VLTLALGIGANTSIFSLIDALMLRWLPVRNPQELALLTLQTPGAREVRVGGSFSYAIVRALADQHEIFTGVAGFSGFSFDVGFPGSVSRVPGAMVTGGYYETLGLNPVIGRLLTREDDEPGAPLVAVASYGYWERQLARSPGAVGQTVRINGVPVTVVGVSPRGFVGANVGSIADLTMAVAALPQVNPSAAPLLGPGNFWLRVLARPRADVPIPLAASRLNAVWPQISEAVIAPHWPASRRKAMADSVFQLSPGGTGWTYLREVYRKPLFVLMAVVGLVLLIACANVASLLLARASARQREIAVRLAIGAGRARIVRQLLIESTLLSLIGAAVGVGLAWVSGRFLVSMISTGPAQIAFDLTPNWHLLGFTSAVAIATGVLFGVAPALQTTAAGPSAALRENPRMSSSRSRLLPSLVSAQVALSLVLLAGAGLFVRTLHNLQNLDPGFSAEGVLLVDLEGRRTAVPRELLEDVQRLPGVVSASLRPTRP
jgi:predicted permease